MSAPIRSRRLFAYAISAGLCFGAPGALLAAEKADEKDDKDENEVVIPLDQVPAPIKATLKKEAPDGKVTEVEKDTEKGKTFYEADVTIDGKAYEIKIAEDGTLISKKLDDEDDDEDEKDDDDKKSK